MEASSLEMPLEERNEYISPFKTLFGAIFQKEVCGEGRAFEGDFAGYGSTWTGGVDNMSQELGMENVLCHGDLWSMNVLWRQNGSNLSMAAVVDYQHISADLQANRILCGTFVHVSAARIAEEHWEQLAEDSIGFISNQEVGDRKMPYTLDQLKEAYRQYFPIGAFMIVPMTGSFFELVCKTTDEDPQKEGLRNCSWRKLSVCLMTFSVITTGT
ncbi:hypothetical protein COOONC_26553 [Cooperia oncophora]